MDTSDKNSVLERRAAMMARLQQIHDHATGEGTAEGAMIVTLEGYISGIPEFFTNDCHEAFRFKDREQAESFVAEFADALLNPQVLDHP
jgi:hypothetical protein